MFGGRNRRPCRDRLGRWYSKSSATARPRSFRQPTYSDLAGASSFYTLQQVSDLSNTNWVGVTNAITVTNYRDQVILAPPATGNAFYRLQGPNQ
jgi:hypothetical protein